MEKLLLGIDDAGRGPVLGPMAMAGILIRESQEQELKEKGIKDSKLLLPRKRAELLSFIEKETLANKLILITPKEIDTGFGEGYNLNEVEALAAASIIDELTTKITQEQRKELKIIIDCPSINTSRWKEQVINFLREKNIGEKVSCEHKADFYHPVVSAASILAKVNRDREIEKLKREYNIDFGSGYPSDPKTVDFLNKNHSNPKFKGLFRESWATFKQAGIKTSVDKQKKLF